MVEKGEVGLHFVQFMLESCVLELAYHALHQQYRFRFRNELGAINAHLPDSSPPLLEEANSINHFSDLPEAHRRYFPISHSKFVLPPFLQLGSSPHLGLP